MHSTDDDRNPLVEFARRRWPLLLVAAMIAAVGGGCYAVVAAQRTYLCNATMLYNRSLLGAPHYQQPEATSIIGLFKSRNVLEALARETQPTMTAKGLYDSTTAELVLGSGTINLQMRAGDADAARQRLDRLMQLVVEQAAGLRRAAVAQILAGLEKHLAEARSAADRAYEDLNRFHAAHQIVTSVDDDLERVHDDIAAVERLAETDRPATASPEEVLQRGRSAIQERLNHERDTIARESQLALKKDEYERAARLHAKRYISDGEFRRVEAEYRTLAAQNAEALRVRNEQIGELDRLLESRLDPKSSGAAATTDSTTAALSARLQGFLRQRRAEGERLSALRPEAARLEQTVRATEDEVRRVAALIASYVELREAPYNDLVVVQPAVPALDPVSSNAKKLFVGGMLGGLMVLLVPLFLFDWRAASRADRRKMKNARLPSLPVLASAVARGGEEEAARKETIRTLALRLQQLPSSRGIAAALNSLDSTDVPTAVAIQTAECLHRRGERVLILETTGDSAAARLLTERTGRLPRDDRDVVAEWISPSNLGKTPTATLVADPDVRLRATAQTAPCGLAELLLDPECTLADAVRPGEAFDVLTLGERPLPDEALASRRLTAVLDECRRNYGVVLLLGPGLNREVDLELLAARVDGLVFLGDERSPPAANVERVVTNLNRIGAPILGAVYL